MKKKGRSSALIQERDRALITRYWYWSEVWQRRHEMVLQALMEEFFLMPRRIEQIIRDDDSIYKQLTKEGPSCKELARRFPMFRFEDNPVFGKRIKEAQAELF